MQAAAEPPGSETRIMLVAAFAVSGCAPVPAPVFELGQCSVCLLCYLLLLIVHLLMKKGAHAAECRFCTEILRSMDWTGTRARLGAPASPSTRCWGRPMS